jgi:hypothetical protein
MRTVKKNPSPISTKLEKRHHTPRYPVGPDHRLGHEGWIGAIGGWTGDLSKRGTWLAPATGKARNRPIEDLIDWLNANPSTEQGKRLRALISDLKKVEALSRQIDQVTAYQISPLVTASIWAEPEPMGPIRFAHKRVKAACKRYCLYPRLTWVMWEKNWNLSFYADGEIGEVPVVYNGPDDYGRRVFETDAAIVVIGIAERGEISRLRACEQCGSWFFASANTSHNARKFCTESCRLKHFHERKAKAGAERKSRRSKRAAPVLATPTRR